MLSKKTNRNISNWRSPAAVLVFWCFVLCSLYFVRSFVLYIDIINPVGMEECHTGAVAREILKHGFQFPLEQYTPEYYENSILVGSLLTVVSAWALGLSRLSVELVPFAFSFATLLVFIALLRRGGYGQGVWFFILSFFFVSGTFVYLTMDSVGNHIIGLFAGAVILNRFYEFYITRDPRCFYQMMFLAGLGLFLHLGSLLYTGLCVLVYVFYRPATGRRPGMTAAMATKGMLLFLLGVVPFIIFLFKTRVLSATYLIGVVDRRSTGISAWGAYSQAVIRQFLFQFDNRPEILVFYLAMVVFVWQGWARIRQEVVPENTRLLHYMICFFPVPVFLAVAVVSGGEFTTYYTYMLPWLFMAGAAWFARLALRFPLSARTSWVVCFVLCISFFFLLMPGSFRKQLNVSPGYAWHKLTANNNQAFCYWRFGRSFGNYVLFDGDSEQYASKILTACGRFDSAEKRDECLWGWSVSGATSDFTLDTRTMDALGSRASGLIAQSLGGWTPSVATCLNVDKAYVDDCILGFIERNALNVYSVAKPGASYIRIPCRPSAPRFSGFVQESLDRIRQGSLDNGPQTCSRDLNILCIQADAYCAAIENRLDFCGTASYPTSEDENLCQFIFDNVWMARQAGK